VPFPVRSELAVGQVCFERVVVVSVEGEVVRGRTLALEECVCARVDVVVRHVVQARLGCGAFLLPFGEAQDRARDRREVLFEDAGVVERSCHGQAHDVGVAVEQVLVP